MRRLAICSVLFAGTVVAQFTEEGDPLPSVECVQMIRTARGMLASGDRQGGVELLRETIERFPAAIEVLNRALELAPDRSQAHYYLYACYVEMEDHDAAREALRRYNGR